MSRASVALVIGLALGAALGSACGDDHHRGPGTSADLPLPDLTLPNFSCRDLPAMAGSCQRDDDCGTGQVCGLQRPNAASDRAQLSLSCDAPVGTFANRTRCQAGGDCASGLCALSGVCVPPCAADSDCKDGQFCAAVEVRVGDDGLAPAAACARSSAFPSDVRLAIDNAAITSGKLNNLDIAGGAGTSVYFFGAACDVTVQVQGLFTRPDGSNLFDIDSIVSGKITDNPVVNLGAIVPMLVPNNPAVAPSASGYAVEIVADLDADVHVVSATRASRGNTLDLNLFYVGGGESVKSGGFHPGSEEIAAMVAQLTTLYEPLRITLGEVREYEVVGALRDEFSVLETSFVRDENDNPIDISIPGLEDLFRLSAGLDDGGINVFLVSDMGDVLGISGGIPGTLGLHGTSGSGVSLAVDVAGLDELPYVAQHEISHQMGLFHTSEIDGYSIEPLADTPICNTTYDRNGDGVLTARECRGHGGENLMFWSSTGSQISEDQADVLRASLILR